MLYRQGLDSCLDICRDVRCCTGRGLIVVLISVEMSDVVQAGA